MVVSMEVLLPQLRQELSESLETLVLHLSRHHLGCFYCCESAWQELLAAAFLETSPDNPFLDGLVDPYHRSNICEAVWSTFFVLLRLTESMEMEQLNLVPRFL